MSYLINANKAISTAVQLQNEGAEYTELAEAGYQIPAVWLMFFNDSDFIESQVEYVDGDGHNHITTIYLPCTTVSKAKENIENSHHFFGNLFEEPEIAIGYLNKTIELFTELDHEYLILDASEYFLMNVEESDWHLFKNAFLRNEKAKSYILHYSGYVTGDLPYPIDEFYSDPYLDNSERINNSTALNPSFSDIPFRMKFPFKDTNKPQHNVTVKDNKKWWEFWKR